MTAKGNLHPCDDKSQVVGLLEGIRSYQVEGASGESVSSCKHIVMDCMGVLHEV